MSIRCIGAFAFVASLVAACAAPTFRNYDVDVLPDEHAAIVRNHVWWGGCPGCVQGIWTPNAAVVYDKERDGRVTEFRLVPGVYAVWYAYHQPRYCHGQTYGLVDRVDTVELQSGHVYRIRLERDEWSARCGTVRRNLSQPRVWIEDQTTDRIVAGDNIGKPRGSLK